MSAEFLSAGAGRQISGLYAENHTKVLTDAWYSVPVSSGLIIKLRHANL
jgi:hypothetical protein